MNIDKKNKVKCIRVYTGYYFNTAKALCMCKHGQFIILYSMSVYSVKIKMKFLYGF